MTMSENLASSTGPHILSRYLPAKGREIAEMRNSVKVVSQKALVTSVQGYQKLTPGTMTSAGKAMAESLRLNWNQ